MTIRMTASETKDAMQLVVSEMYDKIVKGEPPTMTCLLYTSPSPRD